jgi:hypothetical protein
LSLSSPSLPPSLLWSVSCNWIQLWKQNTTHYAVLFPHARDWFRI